MREVTDVISTNKIVANNNNYDSDDNVVYADFGRKAKTAPVQEFAKAA